MKRVSIIRNVFSYQKSKELNETESVFFICIVVVFKYFCRFSLLLNDSYFQNIFIFQFETISQDLIFSCVYHCLNDWY